MKTKRVQYSYPTSPNAEKFNKPTGCWCVEIVNESGIPKAITAHDTKEAAIIAASALDLKWNWLQFKYNECPFCGYKLGRDTPAMIGNCVCGN